MALNYAPWQGTPQCCHAAIRHGRVSQMDLSQFGQSGQCGESRIGDLRVGQFQ
jgi:hypothetical protein